MMSGEMARSTADQRDELAPPRIVPTVQVEKMAGTTAVLGGWRHDANAMRHWRLCVLNPWFAITFHAARLGFEAQNAAAFRFLRLVGNASRTEADEIISDAIAPPLDSTSGYLPRSEN
jgi:hypothetical protein